MPNLFRSLTARVILVTAAEALIPVVEYNPRAVKMATTGFGSANKVQMQDMVRRHLNLKEIPKPDDAADALALALCHLQTHHHLKVPTSRRSRAARCRRYLPSSSGRPPARSRSCRR